MVKKVPIHFGTDGWRAIMCDTFTLANVRIVAQAVADYLKEKGEADKGLVIGYDNRFFSEHFAQACAEVLLANKIKTYLTKRSVPTPVAAYAIKTYSTAGAIMITASHNPPEYNGIKFIPEYAGPASKEITNHIEANIGKIVQNGGILEKNLSHRSLLEYIDPFPDYITHLRDLLSWSRIKAAKLRLVVDPLFGSGIGYLDVLLAEAGCQIITIHNRRDVLFGGIPPDPNAERLKELASLVIKEKADLGLALDGDADRFGVVDCNGDYIQANQVVSLIAVHLLKNKGWRGAIVRSVATTHLLDAIAQDYRVDLIETPVGFKYIAQAMQENQVLLGGEESNGLTIGKHIPEKDGLLADLLLAELVAYEGKSLSEILSRVYQKYGNYFTKRIDIRYRPEDKKRLLTKINQGLGDRVMGYQIKERVLIDGVKLIFTTGDWLLIRPSGTEPVFRIYIETNSAEAMERLTEFATKFVK